MASRMSKVEVLHKQRTVSGRLSEAQVARIKWRTAQGEPKRDLAREYGVSLWTIRAIARGDTWDWVAPDDGAGMKEAGQLDTIAAQASEARLARMMAEARESRETAERVDSMLNEVIDDHKQET